MLVVGGGKRLMNFCCYTKRGYGELSETRAEFLGWGVSPCVCVCARALCPDGALCVCKLGSETGELQRREKLRAGTTQAIG